MLINQVSIDWRFCTDNASFQRFIQPRKIHDTKHLFYLSLLVEKKMKIVLIVVYFGQWPVWFPAFLRSCKYNNEIDWLFFTDCPVPETTIENVHFIPFTAEEFNVLATKKIGYQITLTQPYKLCDFKPCYGLLFADYIKNYDFWGHCDLDIIWGQIREFITDDILLDRDVISARKQNLCGHFTLYRNNLSINTLFTRHPDYQTILQSEKVFISDEHEMTDLVRSLANQNSLRVYWPKFLLNFAHPVNDTPSILGEFTNRWYWQQGKLYERGEQNNRQDEIMYLHFMTWKKTLQKCSFNYYANPKSFYISYSQISCD